MSYLKHIEYNEELNIARGLVRGASVIHKFGRNPSVGGAPENIIQQGGTYTYLTSPSTVYVTSSSGNDAAAGTGARTVRIEGLDVNYNTISETLTVEGAGGTAEFLRVFRAFVASAGSVGTNVGNISVTTEAGGSGTLLTTIGTIGTGTTFGLGQTMMAQYTIPAHCTGYLTNWNIGVGNYNDSVTATLYTREIGNGLVFRTRDVMDVTGGFHQRIYNVPFSLPEKTDIEVKAIASTGSVISSSFDIIVIENDFVESRSNYG